MSRIVVGGILLRGDEVLLVKRAADRAYYPGVWDIAGGHSEDGETPAATLIRELAEELGVVPIEYNLLGIIPETTEGLSFHAYLVIKWLGAPSNLQPHEHSEVTWIRITDVEALELASPAIPVLLQSIRK